jgi:hypothetical protein
LFLNQDKLGRFGCKCNQPANNKADDNNNKFEPSIILD